MASFMQFGLRQGLAYTNDWTGDMNRELKQEQLDKAASDTREAKAQLLGDKFKFAVAEDSYVGAQLKAYMKGVMSDIGIYTTEHPNFRSNTGEWIEFTAKTDSLLNNDLAVRQLRNQTQYKAWTDFLNKNPDYVNDLSDPTTEVGKMAVAYSNYKKTGSSDGIQGNDADFMFVQPTTFDVSEYASEISKQFGKKTENWYSPSGTYFGIKNVLPSDEEIFTAASAGYKKNKAKIDAKWNGLSQPEKDYLGSAFKMFENLIKKGLDVGETSISQYHVASSSGGGGGNSSETITPFQMYNEGVVSQGTKAAYSTPAAIAYMNVAQGNGASDPVTLVPGVDGYQHLSLMQDGKLTSFKAKSLDDFIVDGKSNATICDADGIPVSISGGTPALVKSTVLIPEDALTSNWYAKQDMPTNQELVDKGFTVVTQAKLADVIADPLYGDPTLKTYTSQNFYSGEVYAPYNSSPNAKIFNKYTSSGYGAKADVSDVLYQQKQEIAKSKGKTTDYTGKSFTTPKGTKTYAEMVTAGYTDAKIQEYITSGKLTISK